MAPSPTLTLESLAALGAEALATLILEEADGNAAFRRRADIAVAGTEELEAVTGRVDRRLSALERARTWVSWEKEPALVKSLERTLEAILDDVARQAPAEAVDRLLRLLETQERLFARLNDPGGRVGEVYERAAGALPALVDALSEYARAAVPGRLTAALSRDAYSLFAPAAVAMVPKLPEAALRAWDRDLDALGERAGRRVVDVRQAIADALGDLDGYLALEETRSVWLQNPLAAADRLLAAGRPEEALAWLRRGDERPARAGDGSPRRPDDLERVRLEARILEAANDLPAAQALRLACFTDTPDAGILRDYLDRLEEDESGRALDETFALAAANRHPHTALAFFIAWPRLDLAAALVLDRRKVWNGRNSDDLAAAASVLSADHPLAATVLYRVLLDDVLERKKSAAYEDGAGYLRRLTDLAPHVPRDRRVISHATYVKRLREAHGRKRSFWGRVGGAGI